MNPLTEEEVVDNMKRWQEAFEAGAPNFFDFFDDHVSLFTLSTPTRVDGREVYRRGFEQFFLGTTRNSQILSPEVRLLGPELSRHDFSQPHPSSRRFNEPPRDSGLYPR